MSSDSEKEIQKHLDELKQNGLDKVLHAYFMDDFIGANTKEILSLDEIISRYGDVLTQEQLTKLKEYAKTKKGA